jgi:DNA topoisomerase-1
MAKTLVIVESPAKARTIERILKGGYEVFDGQFVRVLPESADEIPDEIRKKKWGRLGVDTDGDFKPYYVIPNDKRKQACSGVEGRSERRHAGLPGDRPRSRR